MIQSSLPPVEAEGDAEDVSVELLLGVVRVALLELVAEPEAHAAREWPLVVELKHQTPVLARGTPAAVNLYLARVEAWAVARLHRQKVAARAEERSCELRLVSPTDVPVLRVLRPVLVVAEREFPLAAALLFVLEFAA